MSINLSQSSSSLNQENYSVNVEMGFFSPSEPPQTYGQGIFMRHLAPQDETKEDIEIISVPQVVVDTQAFRESVEQVKGDEKIQKRKFAPTSHWSEKLAWTTSVITGIATASGIIMWSVPQLNPYLFSAIYVAVPTGIVSTASHCLSACFLKKFVPQKALEESVSSAEDVTLDAKKIVKKLQTLEEDLAHKNADIQILTNEREALSQSLQENLTKFKFQIQNFTSQNEQLEKKVSELTCQIDELSGTKDELLNKLESFKIENEILKGTIAKASQLGMEAKLLVEQMGVEVDLLDNHDDNIADQVQALSLVIIELKKTTEKQKQMLADLSSAREATLRQNEVILEKLALIEKAKADLQDQLKLLEKENSILSESIQKFIDLSSGVAKDAKFFDENDDKFFALAQTLTKTESGLRELVKIQDTVIKTRDSSIAKLQEEIASLQKLSGEVKKESLTTQDILKSMDKQQDSFLKEIASLKIQITDYEQLKLRKESELSALTSQVDKLNTTVVGYKAVNAQMEGNLAKLLQKLRDLGVSL
jgi:chromosome segregation ATPase